MADTPEQQGDGITSPAQTPPAGSGQPDSQEPSGASTTDDLDHWRTEAKEARGDAAKYRRRLRELEAEVAQMRTQAPEPGADDAKVREAVAKERAERDQLAERLRGVALKASVAAAAADLDIVDTAAALALLDRSAVEWDGDEPDDKSVRQALTELLDSKPYLKRQPPAGIAPAGTGRDGGGTGSTQVGETDDQRRARLYGGGAGGIFDPRRAAQQGGGVVGY